MQSLFEELDQHLATSDARLRKHWAQRVVAENIPFRQLLPLLHRDKSTAQRFSWFIGDLLKIDPSIIQPSIPLLFAMRDEMPFPGMQRIVAWCLWLGGLPEQIHNEARSQLLAWLEDDKVEIGVKHYSSKALLELCQTGKFPKKRLKKALIRQSRHANPAHASRMQKMLEQLGDESA